MRPVDIPDPCHVVIFGAGGDLTRRKLVPALYNLFLDGYLPERFEIIGLDRIEMNDDAFRDHLREGVAEFSRRGMAEESSWHGFAAHLNFITAEFDKPKSYAELSRRLEANEQAWNTQTNRIYYLAIPPTLIEIAVRRIGEAGLSRDPQCSRVVVEKPFGRDLESARALNQLLDCTFREPQIYRIDHYLGKETVQNILAFRFANSLFEPLWNRRYIDHVQITVAESIGVGHRGSYYEHAGALRDMVQNHLSQVLCLIAMEPPTSFQADEVRNRKVDLLRAIRPIPRDQVLLFAVRGQYDEGWIRGEHVQAYRAEPGVDPHSPTDTFAAVKYYVDNWRWQGVPFYLRTGKRLPARVSEVTVQFHPVPHQPFPASAIGEWQPNRLTIRIQPDEGIVLRFQAKLPGLSMRLGTVQMRFNYQEAFRAPVPEAYETLLLDVMQGDTTQFMRADQIEVAWAVIMPVLEAWESLQPGNFPNYAAGTWGPEEAIALIARDGRNWVLPTTRVNGPPEEGGPEESGP